MSLQVQCENAEENTLLGMTCTTAHDLVRCPRQSFSLYIINSVYDSIIGRLRRVLETYITRY